MSWIRMDDPQSDDGAVKYIWRADLKADAVQDLQKARWYIDRELQRRGAGNGQA